MDEAGEFFLRKMHALELYGEIQVSVIEYRQARKKLIEEKREGEVEELFERYHEMLIDLYRENLEHWINENVTINFHLKSR